MNRRGSITIYLSLVLTVILSLVCTLIESARINAIEAKVSGITYMGLDSSFADYASPLFEEYGLLFLWNPDNSVDEKLSNYITYNTDLGKGVILEDIDLYHINIDEIEIEEVEYATDKQGEIFSNQMKQYMKYSLAENVVEEILAQTDLFNQGSKVKKFYDRITQFSDELNQVENAVSEVKNSIEKIKSSKEDPVTAVMNILDTAQEMKNANVDNSSEIEYQLHSLNITKDRLMQHLEEIKNKTQNYSSAAANATKVMSTLSNELIQDKDSLGQDLFSCLEKELKELENKSTNNGNDYYGIQENNERVDAYIAKLNNLEGFMNSNPTSLLKSNPEEYIKNLTEMSNCFLDFDINLLGISYESNNVNKEENSILDYIDGLMENGVLGLVVENPDSISKESIESKELPSATSFHIEEQSQEKSVVNAVEDKVIFSEYAKRKFGSYINPIQDTKVVYELEYILNGKNTDKENVAATVNDLALIRQGCNLVYLLQDSQKRMEAFQLATTIVGVTGLPILITLTQFLILNAWAYAESILDVKNLMAGEKVPVFKTNSEWNLSLSGVKNINKSTDSSKSISSNGLDYQQYLQILLLTKNSTKQYYRAMDIIQLNLCKRENASFQLNQCINRISIQAIYSAKPMFITMPFVKNILGFKDGRYIFKSIQKYEY